jgi:integrase
MTKQSSQRRRPMGSGTIRNRGSERLPKWHASYYVVDADGRHQVSKGPFDLKTDAEAWLRDELARARDGKTVRPTPITVGEVLNDWLTTVRHGLAPITVHNYESIVSGRLIPHLGRIRARDLRPAQISATYNKLRAPGGDRRTTVKQQGLSEASLGATHAVLRSALQWAVKTRLIPSNPADDIDRPKRGQPQLACWTADQLTAFLRHAEDDRLFPLWRLAALSGMRRSELLGLRWEAVDFDASTISVVTRRVRVGNAMIEGTGTKTTAGRRRIDIDPATMLVMKKWRTHQTEERLAWGPGWTDTGLVFTREDGLGLHADRMQYRFAQLVAGAAVTRLHFHGLRHTHATLLLRRGVPVKVVSERLGHSSPAFTMSVYQHVLPGMQAEAAALAASLVDG